MEVPAVHCRVAPLLDRQIDLTVWIEAARIPHGKQDPRVSELLKTVAKNDRDEEVRESAKSLLDELDAE